MENFTLGALESIIHTSYGRQMHLETLFMFTAVAHLGYGLSTEGYNICIGRYTLCSEARCDAIAGNSTHANCYCEGPFDGLNIGHSSCVQRSESLMSTFSLHNIFPTVDSPITYSVDCVGQDAGVWANCLDAPCSTTTGVAVCNCPIEPVSNNTGLSAVCPQNASALEVYCGTLRSAANAALTSTTQDLLKSFYGKPPSISACTSG